MNSPCLISIIIPCYNCADSIQTTLDSVFQQDYECEYEVLIINDCSIDQSLKMVDNLMQLDNRIKVFNTERPSGRPAIPRNLGIEKAKGDYLLFLDSDDCLPSNYVSSMIGFVNNYRFCGALKYTFSGKPPYGIDSHRDNQISFELPRLIQYSKNMFSMSGLFLSKNSVIHIRFPNIYLEDWRFINKLYNNGVKGRLFVNPKIYWRKHQKSITPKNKLIQIKRVYSALNDMNNHFVAPFLFLVYFLMGALKKLLESKNFLNFMVKLTR